MAHPVFLDQTHNHSKIITLSKPVFKTCNSSLSNLMWLSWNCTKVLKKRNKSTSSPPSSLSSPLYLESHVTKTSAFCKESSSYWQESICREREQNLSIFFLTAKHCIMNPLKLFPLYSAHSIITCLLLHGSSESTAGDPVWRVSLSLTPSQDWPGVRISLGKVPC